MKSFSVTGQLFLLQNHLTTIHLSVCQQREEPYNYSEKPVNRNIHESQLITPSAARCLLPELFTASMVSFPSRSESAQSPHGVLGPQPTRDQFTGSLRRTPFCRQGLLQKLLHLLETDNYGYALQLP